MKKHPVALHTTLTNGCDPSVAKGVRRFFEEVTISCPDNTGQRIRHPSFSLTSRRYSIWAKLRDHVEAPLANSIRDYEGPWVSKLLTGFKVSTIGRTRPIWCIDVDAWSKATSEGDSCDWDRILVPLQHAATSQRRVTQSTPDRLVENINAWNENLLFVRRSASASVTAGDETQFVATIETVRDLLTLLCQFRPKRGADPFSTHDGVHPQLPDNKTRIQGETYCELCWRPSMRSAAMGRRSRVPDIRSRQLSNRFCAEHDPSDPTSRYRADHRYKKAFQWESLLGTRSEFLVKLAPPLNATQDEARKTAYDRVHARLRSLNQPDKPSFRETAWHLHQQGMRQADIARQLGTSRQSIFRTLKQTTQLLADHEKRRALYFRRENYGTMSEHSNLIDAVTVLNSDGYKPAEIAKTLGTSVASVLLVLQWLKDHPLHE